MKTSWVVIAVLAVGATFSAMSSSDAELTDRIVGYLRPRCGGNHIRDEREPELIEVLDIQGDTNRLARLLVELAHTNDNWNASMALWQLEKYGTSEQLPFLYSCATNPAVGDRAVKAVLRIEGITSNSLEVARDYLFQTNRFPYANISDRSNVCRDLIERVSSDSDLTGFRSNVLEMVQFVAKDFDLLPSVLDTAVISEDPGFRYSKRRLAILRTAMQRQNIEYQDIVSSNNEVWKRTYVHSFQTNYLQNAINELVAYPEANLPD